MIRPEEVNKAYEHLAKGDIAHRFVMDMSSLEVEA